MSYVLAITFFAGQTFYIQYADLETCRARLLQEIDNGNYKRMKSAECINISNEDM